jgi:integrase
VPAQAYSFRDVEGVLIAPDAEGEGIELLRPPRLWAVFHADLVRRRRAPRTIEAYRQTLLSFWSFIDPKPPLRATPKDMQRFLDRPSRGRGKRSGPVLAESSRATYARQIRAFYRWCTDEELTVKDRMSKFVPLRNPEPIPRALVAGDLAALFDHLEHLGDPRLKVIAWLAYFAALRAGEIARLRVEHIHLRDNPPWMLVHGKGARVRQVPVGPVLTGVLADWLATRPRTGPFLPDRRYPTRNIGPGWVSHLLARVMRDAGLDDTGHALRHSWATDTLAAGRGRNVRAVSYVLGHATSATTERTYTRSYRADAVEAVQLTRDPRAAR